MPFVLRINALCGMTSTARTQILYVEFISKTNRDSVVSFCSGECLMASQRAFFPLHRLQCRRHSLVYMYASLSIQQRVAVLKMSTAHSPRNTKLQLNWSLQLSFRMKSCVVQLRKSLKILFYALYTPGKSTTHSIMSTMHSTMSTAHYRQANFTLDNVNCALYVTNTLFWTLDCGRKMLHLSQRITLSYRSVIIRYPVGVFGLHTPSFTLFSYLLRNNNDRV